MSTAALVPERSPAVGPRRLAYVTLQSTGEGHASHAHVHEIVRGLQDLGWSVRLFAPLYGASRPGLLRRLFTFAGLQLRAIVALARVDALYLRSHVAAFPIVLISKLFRRRVVQELNGPWSDFTDAWPHLRFAGAIGGRLFHLQLRWADHVIAVTPGLAAYARALGQRRVTVVANGANTSLFSPDARAETRGDRPYVVFFGAFARWQGIATMLEAVECEEWPKDVDLLLVGDGAERPKVEAAVERCPRVRYTGAVGYFEVPRLVAGAIAALCPKDGAAHTASGLSPLKLYESLACGLPVIVTDIAGQADLVREVGCGIVVPIGDAVALAEAVARIAGDPEEAIAMGARGRTAVVESHSWKRRAEEVAAVLTDAAP